MFTVALVDLISDWKPIQLSLTREMKQQKFKIYDNHIYYSYKPWHPHVGDIRIRYDFAGMSDSANPSHVRNIPPIECCTVLLFMGEDNKILYPII